MPLDGPAGGSPTETPPGHPGCRWRPQAPGRHTGRQACPAGPDGVPRWSGTAGPRRWKLPGVGAVTGHEPLEAAALFEEGHSPSSVAQQLGVARQTAARWGIRWRAGGAAALEYRRGRGPAIPDRQLPLIERALLQGPAAHGFDGEVWSAPQVTEVIERLTGVRLTPSPSSGCCAFGSAGPRKLPRSLLHFAAAGRAAQRLSPTADGAVETDDFQPGGGCGTSRGAGEWVGRSWACWRPCTARGPCCGGRSAG